jgi:hypothetical protein
MQQAFLTRSRRNSSPGKPPRDVAPAIPGMNFRLYHRNARGKSPEFPASVHFVASAVTRADSHSRSLVRQRDRLLWERPGRLFSCREKGFLLVVCLKNTLLLPHALLPRELSSLLKISGRFGVVWSHSQRTLKMLACHFVLGPGKEQLAQLVVGFCVSRIEAYHRLQVSNRVSRPTEPNQA